MSYAVGNKGAEFSLAGLPSPHRELLLNWGTAAPEAAVIASRCHLSQGERPWQSAKFVVQHFTPCCRKGSRQALHSDFTPLPRAPPLGELARSA